MTKKPLLYAVFLLFLFLLYSAGVKVFAETPNLVPQFILLFVISFALKSSLPETLWFSFLAGFLQELFSGEFFGAQIVAFVLAGLLVYFLTRNLTAQELALPTAILLIMIVTLTFGLWVFLYSSLIALLRLAPPVPLGDFYSSKILWTAVLNIVLFFPLDLIVKILRR